MFLLKFENFWGVFRSFGSLQLKTKTKPKNFTKLFPKFQNFGIYLVSWELKYYQFRKMLTIKIRISRYSLNLNNYEFFFFFCCYAPLRAIKVNIFERKNDVFEISILKLGHVEKNAYEKVQYFHGHIIFWEETHVKIFNQVAYNRMT